jgi:hypothetical protein
MPRDRAGLCSEATKGGRAGGVRPPSSAIAWPSVPTSIRYWSVVAVILCPRLVEIAVSVPPRLSMRVANARLIPCGRGALAKPVMAAASSSACNMPS